MKYNSLMYRAVLLIVTVAVLACAWWKPIDESARTHVRADLERALKVFATARAIGAALSVAQSATFDAKILGTGVGVSPGQVLRPAQEFVDRFAALMLAASVAFGVQALLVEFGASHAVAVALTVALLLALALPRSSGRLNCALQAAIVMLLLVRFAVPLAIGANALAYEKVMQPMYQDAVATLDTSPAAISPAVNGKADCGIFCRMKTWLERMKDAAGAIDNIGKAADDGVQHIVRLLALFAIQTVVLPLAFLWIFWRVCRFAVDLLSPPRVVPATRATHQTNV